MCEFMSFIVTKTGKVFFSKDSMKHEDILSENSLKDDKTKELQTFCRVEISPPDKNYRAPLDSWVLKIDEQQRPDWFSEKHEKSVWSVFKKHVFDFLKIDCTFELHTGFCIAIDSIITVMSGGTMEEMSGGTMKWMSGGTMKWMSGGTMGEMSGGTMEKMSGGTMGEMSGGTMEWMSGGTMKWMSGGTMEKMSGGTMEKMSGGTMKKMSGKFVVLMNFKKGLDMTFFKRGVIIDYSDDKIKTIIKE